MRKLIVVTGGTKGIGRAIIDTFAANGFDVVTCSRNEKELQALKQEVESKYEDATLHFQAADLSEKKQALSFGDFVDAMEQPVEILVNNAGLYIPGQVHNEEDGALEQMINTNLYSAYHLSRALLPQMMERKGGHLFTICSTASIMPYVNGGSYCISKFALLGMNKVLREEMKEHNIRVTSVLPGATLTASWEGADIPAERFMKAEDVASAVWNAYAMSANSVVEEILIRPQLGDIV